jgi:hypothetical protein
MVLKEEFEILISKDGKLKITAKGFKGNQCQQPLKHMQQTFADGKPILEEGRTWEAGLAEEDVTESLKLTGGKNKNEDKG